MINCPIILCDTLLEYAYTVMWSIRMYITRILSEIEPQIYDFMKILKYSRYAHESKHHTQTSSLANYCFRAMHHTWLCILSYALYIRRRKGYWKEIIIKPSEVLLWFMIYFSTTEAEFIKPTNMWPGIVINALPSYGCCLLTKYIILVQYDSGTRVPLMRCFEHDISRMEWQQAAFLVICVLDEWISLVWGQSRNHTLEAVCRLKLKMPRYIIIII